MGPIKVLLCVLAPVCWAVLGVSSGHSWDQWQPGILNKLICSISLVPIFNMSWIRGIRVSVNAGVRLPLITYKLSHRWLQEAARQQGLERPTPAVLTQAPSAPPPHLALRPHDPLELTSVKTISCGRYCYSSPANYSCQSAIADEELVLQAS